MTAAGARTASPPGIEEIRAAREAIAPVVRRTPLERSDWLGELAGAEVYLKLESYQRTGSFKLRGAAAALAALGVSGRARGVVTASAGNHGLGVARAARHFGCAATIFLPTGATGVKRERIARLGATLREVPGGYDEAHEAAERFAWEGAVPYIHAFSDPAVVAGQGTVGLEILEQLPDVRTVVVPIGGGGLVAGVGLTARAAGRGVRVVGVQSEHAAAMADSLAAGAPVPWREQETLCDGLAGDIDARSLALAREVVDRVVLVPERAIRSSIRELYLREGVVAEGSGVVGVAAVRAGGCALDGPVAVVVTGGNIDAHRLGSILMEDDGDAA